MIQFDKSIVISCWHVSVTVVLYFYRFAAILRVEITNVL